MLLENPKTKEKTVQLISKQLDEDLNSQNPSLIAKWLPSINTSSFEMRKLALFLCRELGMSNKEYRKTLSTLRKQIGVLERKLSKKEYDFDYAKVPSQAMHKYRQAFNRNDEKRYLEYISDLSKGETKINVGTLYPHQIISKYYKSIINWKAKNIEEYEIKLMEEQWKAMERVETEVNTIVVRDGSGSMWGTPLEIATALAILYSEQLKGEFKDKFITFSSNPELVSLENCKTLQDKLNEVNTYGDCSNTNIELVYNLILKSSINVPEEEQIDKVLIISDMEFDGGWQGDLDIEMSRYDKIKRKYIELNIKMPEIVFWNVNARKIHFPTTDKDNVKLISGYSNYVLQDILKDTTTDPIEFMIETLKKYKDISNKYLL